MDKLIADPFVLQVKDHVSFTEEVLQRVFEMSDDWDEKGKPDNRWLAHDANSWLFMDNLSSHKTSKVGRGGVQQEYFLGTLLRARLDELPMQVSRDGVSPLKLADDEGIGDHMAFLWDTGTGLMWIQRERDIGRTALMKYLRLSGDAVGLVPVFMTDAPARAKKLRDVKKIEVAYLVAQGGKKPTGFFKFINDLEGYGAARIEITVRPVRGAFLDDNAKKAVKEIAEEVEQNTGNVEKAKVWGNLSDDEMNQFVDMLRAREEFSTRIDRQKSRDPTRLMQALKNIWISHRDSVKV